MFPTSQQEQFSSENIIMSPNIDITTKMHTTSAIFTTKLMIMISIFIIIGYNYHDFTPFSVPVDMNGICDDDISNFSHDDMTIHPQIFLFNFLNDNNILGLLFMILIDINDISENNINGHVHRNIFVYHNPIGEILLVCIYKAANGPLFNSIFDTTNNICHDFGLIFLSK